MALHFNINGITNEILNKLKDSLEIAFTQWEIEVMSKVRHNYFGEGTNPKVDSYLKKEGNMIIGFLQANTYVLADSYGTGSFMLDNNPGLEEYKRKNWGSFRHSKAIVGRPKGTYDDIFGRQHTTSGAFEGINIEGKRVYTRKKETEKDYYISPTHPSYAIQLAEQWLYKTYLPRAYQNAIKQINFGKYLIES